jgi:hypothetical protein
VNPTNPGPLDPAAPAVRPATLEKTPRGGLSLTGGVNWLLFFPLVCVYVVIVHFGSLFRFSVEEDARGPSTLIVLVLVALGIGRIVRAFATERLIFWTLSALVIYVAINGALAPNPLSALNAPLELGGYVLLAAAISRTRWHRSQISTLWILMAGGLLVSSSLTIVDYVGMIDVPYNNDATTSTTAAGLEVWQASGFFPRRSGMAAFFGLSITGSLVLALAHKSFGARLYFLAAASSGLLCLFLTHNRSGVFAAIFVIAIYMLLSPRFKGIRRINILLGASVAGGLLLALVILLFPEHLAVYVAKLGFIGLADETWSSDKYRVDLFVAAIRSITENPLGNGFTKIPLSYGLTMNPHNVVTAIIWATGIFSVIWLPLFAAAVYLSLSGLLENRSDRAPLRVESDALTFALFAWLVGGMTHNILFTGLAWIVFGLMLSIRHFRDPEQAGTEITTGTVQHTID